MEKLKTFVENNMGPKESQAQATDTADEIAKFLNSINPYWLELITQEEFDAKKKQLLGL